MITLLAFAFKNYLLTWFGASETIFPYANDYLSSVSYTHLGLAGMILAVPIGLFFMNLYKYGAFDSMIDSFLALVREINAFRKNQ